MDAHLAFRGVGGPRLHLGVCGSVAAYRALDLVRQWQDAGVSVSATLTPSAQKFVTPLTFAALGAAPVYTAPFDDPQAPSPFAHLEPGQVAQALVIAPPPPLPSRGWRRARRTSCWLARPLPSGARPSSPPP